MSTHYFLVAFLSIVIRKYFSYPIVFIAKKQHYVHWITLYKQECMIMIHEAWNFVLSFMLQLGNSLELEPIIILEGLTFNLFRGEEEAVCNRESSKLSRPKIHYWLTLCQYSLLYPGPFFFSEHLRSAFHWQYAGTILWYCLLYYSEKM